MAYLEAGPADSASLARDVLGLTRAARPSAERLALALVGEDPRVTRLGDGRWTLAPGAGESPPPVLDACRFAVVDVETTGGRPRHGDRVIEVAVATLEGGSGQVTPAYQSLVDPGVPIPPVVARLTGIGDALVQGAPRFDEVADELLGVLTGAVFVAHNVRFDWAFLSAEFQRARALLLTGPRLCTARLARRLLPGLPDRSLDGVTRFFGIENPARHRAAGDALAAARALGRLLTLARERGAVTVADLALLQ